RGIYDYALQRKLQVQFLTYTHLHPSPFITEISSNLLLDEKFRAKSSQFIEKSDVYSFRVVIVELLTRKKENHLLDIVDAEIRKDGQKDEVVAVAQPAKRCLNLDGRYRSTMKEVAMELERLRTRQGDCIHTHQLKQAEVIVRKSIESWDFTSFSIKHYPNCSIISTSESDVHPLMLESNLVQDL
ncbi:hypothetical protein Golob_024184, partial [Gossypium lobatum]|nr:hypothetical protein [Gossypium lobatum]